MRWMFKAGLLLSLGFILVPAGFAKKLPRSKRKSHKKTERAAKFERGTGSLAASVAPPQNPAANRTARVGENSDAEAPKFTPLLATTGTLGLFTVETGDTLPKGGFAFFGDVNKFSRMPGSVTLLSLGEGFSYGVTNRLSIYADFQSYGHTHIGAPAQLSLNQVNNAYTQYPGSVFHTLPATGFPGYVEDIPFAANDDGGVGPITVGLKFALLSERLGAPVSLAVRNDFIIPTRRNLADLLDNGTQSGQFNDTIALALSKQFGHVATGTFNWGYEFTRDPRQGGVPLFKLADQMHTGIGFAFLTDRRIQPMMEYTATIFEGAHTPDSLFGARDPIDGVWGVRLYPWKNLGIDVGYRYMLNLKDAHDRNGFVVKVGSTYWPVKPPPVNHPPTASCTADKSVVFADSGDVVTVSATATDPDNDPLMYSWMANGGRLDGTGPQVRWISAGVTPGTYMVMLTVDDGRAGTASCSATIQVNPKPNRAPVIACSTTTPSIFAGEKAHITCNASDPDGDKLNYIWRANAGQVAGQGPAGDFDSTGLAPGMYTVTTRVEDGRGGAAESATGVEVKPVPPPPQASKINECLFGRALSTRIDNVCKRILDDVATRLQNEPRSSAVIVGYADPKERRPDRIAADRATNAVKYLGEKGIDASRVTTRGGSGQVGATARNRRVDIIFVPEGATY